MKINRNELLIILSEALDCVEKEVLGVTDHHAKRVAWLCMQMGKLANMTKEELTNLAISASFHDNALNEFKMDYENGKLRKGATGERHCIVGEESLKFLLEGKADGFILFHHERADGTGPFKKKETEIPLGAQLVHIADEIDLEFALGTANKEIESNIRLYVEKERGKSFSTKSADLFLTILSPDIFSILSDEHIHELSLDMLPVWIEADREIAKLFARIIDYKSPFTKEHSIGVANKAEQMARYYKYDDNSIEKLYMAGALHDIGKLFVDVEVLEKAGRLDKKEYEHIQSHAYQTYRLLSKINGLEEMRDWASYHHEKLNGMGYPFGLKKEEMSKEVRLLACIDIYQALTEDRPYKTGMTHGKAIGILYELADKGELDQTIVEDIDKQFTDGNTQVQIEKTALFQCRVCGYVYETDVVADDYVCPVCKQEAHGFLKI